MRPFLKRFTLCYIRAVVCLSACPVCPVCDVGALWPKGWMDQDETWHQVGLGPSHIVLDALGPSSPSPKGHTPQSSTHIYCGQMAGWIKMPLGMEVSLGPGDFVLNGEPALPPQKGGGSPNFWPISIVAKRLDGPFDTVPACDRWTDRRTDGRTDGNAVASTALAMRALRRAVKMKRGHVTLNTSRLGVIYPAHTCRQVLPVINLLTKFEKNAEQQLR